MFGSTGGFDDVTEFQTFTCDEMKAAVDATHALGKKISIHSYGPAGARDAIRAGADSLEHATDIRSRSVAMRNLPGRSRGGLTTKIHAVVDALGNPVADSRASRSM
jgi:imidazolonepropionase-like amidohydrolase